MAKAAYTAERPRQFDILKEKKLPFYVDGCSERASEFSMPGYQLKPSDRNKLNGSIKEHRGMVDKLNVILKDLKEHDSTLFLVYGLSLKEGENFVHSLNAKQIKYVEATLTKFRQDMEALENKKRSYDRTFKGIHKQHISKRTRKKKNAENGKKEKAD